MRTQFIGATLLSLSLFDSAALRAGSIERAGETPPSPRGPALMAERVHLPLAFQANTGQFDPAVRFRARGPGCQFWLTENETVFQFRSVANGSDQEIPLAPLLEDRTSPTAVLRMRLVGANPSTSVTGAFLCEGEINYLLGNDPTRWRTGVPTYGKVEYREVYPGVNLVFHGNQQELEYDFVVAPGTNPGVIRWSVRGADELNVDEKGELVMRIGTSEARWRTPKVFQELGSTKVEVPCSYRLYGPNEIGFEFAKYDTSLALVIDPVLAYSTLLGGVNNEFGWGAAIDASGNLYLVGSSYSVDSYPTTAGVLQTRAFSATADVVITKLNPNGNALLYSTYLGGSGNDFGLGIEVDAGGNVFVVGTTYAVTTFPTTPGAFQTRFGGGVSDAFVAKLNPSGSALIYSTFLGGSQFDGATDQFAAPDIFDSFWHMGLAIDAAGNAYISGTTLSPDFPTTPGAFQTKKAGAGPSDAFVAKLNPTGTALVYSTYLGGASAELCSDIAVDGSGNAYVVGTTGSLDFPTTPSAFQSSNKSSGNVFVTKLNPAGTGLVYSTYLGGSDTDQGDAIAVDAQGNAYVTGLTTPTPNLPFFPTTPGAYRTEYSGGFYDAFLTKLNAAGSALV